jgi:hypothetical protein
MTRRRPGEPKSRVEPPQGPESYERMITPEDAVPASTPEPLRDSPPVTPREPEPPLPPLRSEPLDLPPGVTYVDDEPYDGQQPVEHVEETPPEPPQPRSVEEILALPYETPLTPWEEKAVREHFGYARSETRTRAERARVAAKIKASTADDVFLGELPPDIAEVWKGSDENVARGLIGAWGLDAFRASALHRVALTERESEARVAPIRKAYVEAQRKAAKK